MIMHAVSGVEAGVTNGNGAQGVIKATEGE
jgi:hypothetical protein